jgi:diaminopimelate decarboxylase
MSRSVLGPDAVGVAQVAQAAGDRDTPFYLYDTEVFGCRVDLLRAALPGGRLYYSAKANPHPRLLAEAAAHGCGLELASTGELDALVASGANPATAILVGPAKSDHLLAAAIGCGVATVVVESERELRRLLGVVASAAPRAGSAAPRVMLRLSLSGARGTLRMSGHQFGMERPEILSCHELLAGTDAVTFDGYHGYLASQLLDAGDIEHNARLVLAAAAELADLGFPGTQLDLGGGFGVGYTDSDGDLDLAVLTAQLGEVQQATVPAATLLFESGRFLAGPSGALVCRVVDVKTIGGRRFVLLDGGMNASGLFGGSNAVRGLRHSVIRDGAPVTGGPTTNICGPLCTPMDRLATGVPCAAEIGDLVVWWTMGAYGLTAAPVNFLSFRPPDEIFV